MTPSHSGLEGVPAVLLATLRELLHEPGQVTVDLVQLDSAVVPLAFFTGADDDAPQLLGVILDGDNILRGNDAAQVMEQLRLLLGEFDGMSLSLSAPAADDRLH